MVVGIIGFIATMVVTSVAVVYAFEWLLAREFMNDEPEKGDDE